MVKELLAEYQKHEKVQSIVSFSSKVNTMQDLEILERLEIHLKQASMLCRFYKKEVFSLFF